MGKYIQKKKGKAMIQYVNKVPSKIDYYEMIRNVYDNIDVSEIATELESTIAAVCAYKGDRLIGMGRVKIENRYLCIEDLIVKLDAYREDVENSIIVNLVNQVNQLKLHDATIRDCLDFSAKEKPVKEVELDSNDEINEIEIPSSLIFGA